MIMADEKEEARLKMKAEANFERNLRYKDSRLRTIGLPTQALAKQIAEKKMMKQREIDEGKAERARNAEIEEMLQKIASDEEEMRRRKAAEMKYEWDAQIKEKKLLKKTTRENEIDSFKNDTPMTFAGDDPYYEDRIAQQREQIRRWTEEDLEYKEYTRQKEKEEDMAQAQLNLTIDEMLHQQQMEEDRLKKEVTRRILSENNELGELKKRLKEEELRRNDEDRNCTLVFGEDAVTDEFGNVSTRDSFRGYTKGQQKQLLMENEELIRLRKEREEQEKKEEEDWYRESLRLQRLMAEAELENERVRSAYNAETQEYLRNQVEEAKSRTKMDDDTGYGKIEGDFFAKFGTSCR